MERTLVDTQGFSDQHWVAAREAAISERLSVPFIQIQQFNDLASDGRGGVIFAGTAGSGGGAPFMWRVPR